MTLPLCFYGSSTLRNKSTRVENITPELVELAKNMLNTMYEANGVGLAAPQVGKNISLVVIDIAKEDEKHEPIIIFNPQIEIEKDNNPLEASEEGCLSVPDIWAKISRPSRINLTYTNEDGETVSLKNVTGKLARVAQHEMDHLNGVMFVDKMSISDRAINASKLKRMAKKNSDK